MKHPGHILVIRLSALGDVAMTIPVLRVLTQTYPSLKITVVTRVFYKPLFDDIPNLEILEADVYGEHKRIGLLKLAKEAKNLGIDAVADLHSVIRSKVLTKYLSLKGIPTATIDKGRAEKKALTRSQDKVFLPLKTTHQRYADVFDALSLKIDLSKHHFPERKKLSPQLNALIGVEPKKLIGIAPFAAFKSKMYPLFLMKEVISSLNNTNKYRIFLFGGGDQEISVLKKIESHYESVSSVAGKLSLKEELALISNLDVMLAMDSGNGHLSAMYGVPTVTLWGVTHSHAGFAPFMQAPENQLFADRSKYPLLPTSVYGNKFPKGYDDAIATIPSEEVAKKIMEII
ncbi:glycosyltransferase family 9 protein [Ulvibacter antarcticus]|uniref:ADP-heptose:LPS heptosyltransferase n=1 Tax=Ulvibacter antarcticus TaxID=442714 RepID=A0A3L9Z6D3_9FLAO|nr:glycosyltransferase family 9 protein [Ulvibacter antarcticus]RMA65968.1 ADP-heptose:LPS heptosyltransferase [Ulvibacter antarcticus]